MRKTIIAALIAVALSAPVQAMDFAAPEAPAQVADMVPREADSFAAGFWRVLRSASAILDPSLEEACKCCLKIGCVLILCAMVREFTPSVSLQAVDLAGVSAISAVILTSSVSLLRLGAETVTELSQYGKLLLPVMCASAAAKGAVSSSAALYMGTALFDAVLSSLMEHLLIPMLYLFLVLAIANAVFPEQTLSRIQKLLRWASEWVLKIILYLFCGYMAVTGVVSGAADANAVRAAKIAISGAVPVVGGILSDAAETVMVSAGILGSGAGIYGLLTVIALFCAPFLQLGVQYLFLKATAAIGTALGSGAPAQVVGDFASVLGLMLGMIGTQAVLLLVSTVCFMGGAG